VLLLPAGCRRTPADVSVDPEAGGEPVAGVPAGASACEPAKDQGQAKTAPRTAGGDLEAPVVIGGSFVARDRVQLTFSEALAPTDAVNPRQFRLSMAYSSRDYQAGYASGYYYDLGGSDTYEPALVVTSLERYDSRPEVLGLQLSRAVPVDLCTGIADTRAEMADLSAEEPGSSARVGVFLHYTSRGSAGVRDLDGNALEDMGGEWALHFGARHKTAYGTEPVMRLDLLVELECPAENLGVSAPPGPD
jgi:hypothetical protein